MRVGTVLADGGYTSEANLAAAGPPQLIPVKTKPEHAGYDPPGTASEKMRQQMLTSRAKKRYRRRAALVEPVNGHLKDRTRLRQFSRRGLLGNNAEAHLAAASLNLLKLYRATPA
jgi:hypothetical protein